MHYDAIIIGAGPAGLFLAQNLGKKNKKVLLLEKNSEAGKKLLISGSGQCNFTHGGSIDHFFECYGDHSKFIKKALTSFDNKASIQFFEKQGIESQTLENGKVFPKDMQSMSIRDGLLSACHKTNVTIKYHQTVTNIVVTTEGFSVQSENNQCYHARNVIIATGGKSYPKTGSDGSGYDLAKSMGHTIISPKPALTYVTIQEKVYAELSGIAFEKVNIIIWRGGKKVKEHMGSVLFTHKGLSGPGILDSSRWIEPGDNLTINFVYPKTYEILKAEFATEIPQRGTEEIGTFFKKGTLPKSFTQLILKVAEVDEHMPCARVSKVERERLISLLTKCPFSISGLGGYHVAMATAGGIHLKEVNPTTMESRKQKGLYFVGEVLDIDGNTGGYNIQAAFATAYICGQAINNKYES